MTPNIKDLLATGKPIAELAEANDHSWFPQWQGFFSAREGLAYALAAENRTVLEIGSWKGRSTMFAAQTAEKIYAVDTWRGDDYAGRGWFFPEFEQNCREQIVAGKIVPVMCDFRQEIVLDQCCISDAIIYDADHSRAALIEFVDMIPLGRRTRVLIHDCDYEHERRAIARIVKMEDRRVTYADRLAVITAADDRIHSRLETRP